MQSTSEDISWKFVSCCAAEHVAALKEQQTNKMHKLIYH